MNPEQIKYYYFLGIGGIGMSALARYFNSMGKYVAGYDKTPSFLTNALENEGIMINYDDHADIVPKEIKENIGACLIVRTPAVPDNSNQLNYFINNGFRIKKRAEVLGLISGGHDTIAIAGTHGKTTVSTMVAHIMHNSPLPCTAFLGGLSKNYNSNLLVAESSEFIIAEADEFDRSFLHLHPKIALITSIDADHLDIYGQKSQLDEAFNLFVGNCVKGATVFIKSGYETVIRDLNSRLHAIYSLEKKPGCEYYAENIRLAEHGKYIFDLHLGPDVFIEGATLGVQGLINVENAVAAASVASKAGVTAKIIKESLSSFIGIKRRFDYQVQSHNVVFIDDYAHHPREIDAFLGSVKAIYKDKKITGIFQPHLFSRTRDFANEFAASLSTLDELVLLDIYPAREKPIAGITSDLIFESVSCGYKVRCSKNNLLECVEKLNFEVLVTMGAGDIDTMVAPIKEIVLKKYIRTGEEIIN